MLKMSLMKIKAFKFISVYLFLTCCSTDNLTKDIDTFIKEDFYFGMPGSKFFYRTTTKETQEQYHYAECHKKFPGSHPVNLESCVTSYWIKAKNL